MAQFRPWEQERSKHVPLPQQPSVSLGDRSEEVCQGSQEPQDWLNVDFHCEQIFPIFCVNDDLELKKCYIQDKKELFNNE